MEQSAFLQLSLILVFTLVISSTLQALKQPLILGYILSGLLLSNSFFQIIGNSDAVNTFSQIGIAFLLFLVGLNLNPRYIKETGAIALLIALGHAVVSTTLGWLLGLAFGFSNFQAFLIGVTLSFSSTIIITKILSDLHDLETLYGKIVSGFLILQDLLAMFFLIFLAAVGKGGNLGTTLLSTSLKGVGLICILTAFTWVLLPKITRMMAKSQELLMLFSITWCLLIASLFNLLDFSIEIGALFAGISLSVSPFRYEISSKIKALRDFFVMLYFVIIGAKMNFGGLDNLVWPLIALTLFVIFIQPLATMLIVQLLGYPKKVAFRIGISVGQVSEFSLIIGAMAVQFNLLPNSVLALVTLILLITAVTSTYLLQHSHLVYQAFEKWLPDITFLRKPKPLPDLKIPPENEIILLGYSHFGSELVEPLTKITDSLLIVDYDPQIISQNKHKNLKLVYGDISNPSTQEEIELTKSKLVISTIKDFATNLTLIHHIRKHNSQSIIVAFAHTAADALKLYEEGANYVIIPNLIGASHIAAMITEIGLDLEKFSLEKKHHINKLLIKHQLS